MRWPFGGRPRNDARGGFLGGAHSVRPHCKAGRKPGHNIIIWGQTNVRWPNGAIPRPEAKPLSRACGARPSRGVSRGEMAFRRKARRCRERWSSRRGAVSAPAKTGRTQTGACHRDPRVGEKPVAKRGVILWSAQCLPLRACGARPSAEWPSEGQKALPGQTRRWRDRRFFRRDALCASAWQGRTQAGA